MPCTANGLYVVQGEMAVLLAAMRRGNRWSSHSSQDINHDVLIQSFVDLKDVLNQLGDLKDLDPNHYLAPFLEVIRAGDTTGPVTSIALSAVQKFLSYGLIDKDSKSLATTLDNIADAVTHTRFVSTDQNSDGVVLLKILLVLRTLVLSPLGVYLTNESICEIMLSSFRICFEPRLTEHLRKSAEFSLKDLVQHLFARLPEFTEDNRIVANVKKLKMHKGSVETSKQKKKKKLSQKKVGKPKGPSSEHINIPSNPVLDLQGNIHQSSLEPSSLESSILESPTVVPEEIQHVSNSLPGNINASNSETQPSESEIINNGDEVTTLTENTTVINVETDISVGSLEDLTINNSELLKKAGSLEDVTTNNVELVKIVGSLDDVTTNNVELVKNVGSLEDATDNQDYINKQGVRFTSDVGESDVEPPTPLLPYGIGCIRELFRFLVSLVNPTDKQNTEQMIQVGLSLLTVAMEVAADAIGKYNSLLVLVKDELCRNLFSLLYSDRISIFANDLQLCFLLFEALRTHLKFQLELYLTKLIEMIVSDSPKVVYEQKEIALESVVQLWRIPGLVTELYLNYDCDLYCPNLFEDLTKLLSKNAFPVAGIYNTHLLSLDALLTIIDSIESHCHNRILNEKQNSIQTVVETDIKMKEIMAASGRSSRQKISENIPSHEQLMAIKRKKKLLSTGTEQFNAKPKKGIQFLQEHHLLSTPLDPKEVIHFLRENPHLDKKMIGEYISNRTNLEVLDAFVKSFDFTDTRIDEALRLYLETFRLPGESPVIALIMEHFAEHWHKSNGEPLANADAAFTLAYAVIMLNVDQHNHNVKRQNIPMTVEDFKKNLKAVNGGDDFEDEMLNEIYYAIKNDEIVMPAEQTGLVKENYLWKVLLRRGGSKDGVYLHSPNGLFDHDLFSLIWGPTIAALSFVFDKSNEVTIYQKAISGFRKCAMISAHYGMSSNFDNLVISLCKFSNIVSSMESADQLTITFGSNPKAQLSAKTMFQLVHRHGDILREGWKNVLQTILQLYRCKLLPKSLIEAEDFIEQSGKISLIREEVPSQKTESGIFSSLYSYIALGTEVGSQRVPSQEDQEHIKLARHCIRDCQIDQIIIESKFLRLDSLQELVKSLISLSVSPGGASFEEDTAVFFLEILIKVVIQNRDRANSIWPHVCDHIYSLIVGASACEHHFLMERSVVGLLRLAIRLMRREEMSPVVLQSLRMLLLLKPTTLQRVSRQIAYGIYEVLKTSAANIHSCSDWTIIFTLLECVGAGAVPSKMFGDSQHNSDQGAKSEGDVNSGNEDSGIGNDRGYTSDSEINQIKKKSSQPASPEMSPNTGGGWILVGREGEIQTITSKPLSQLNMDPELMSHDPFALVKCCESLAFLVRDVAHITPYNFESCVHCIRTFVEASLNGYKQSHKRQCIKKDVKSRKKVSSKKQSDAQRAKSPTNPYDADESDSEEFPSGYHQISIQLLDLMHTLHTRTAQIFHWWAEENKDTQITSLWAQGWCPLLQGIARLCCDSRKQVRMSAITYLQRALLVHDLQTLSPDEWESCFNKVLFPLLGKLLELEFVDESHLEETRMRAATVLSKVFLHHLTPLLSLPTFTSLWLKILDYMDKYMHVERSDLLYEAIPESLKNMLLVMDSAKVFNNGEEYSPLWNITWDRINSFLPCLQEEFLKSRASVPKLDPTFDLEATSPSSVIQSLPFPDPVQNENLVLGTEEAILPSLIDQTTISPEMNPVMALEEQSPSSESVPLSIPFASAPVPAVSVPLNIPGTLPDPPMFVSSQSKYPQPGAPSCPMSPPSKGKSIILQPPTFTSPIFNHLGQQMLTTNISGQNSPISIVPTSSTESHSVESSRNFGSRSSAFVPYVSPESKRRPPPSVFLPPSSNIITPVQMFSSSTFNPAVTVDNQLFQDSSNISKQTETTPSLLSQYFFQNSQQNEQQTVFDELLTSSSLENNSTDNV